MVYRILGKAKEILDGYRNYFVNADQETKNEAKRRASICSVCPEAKYGIHSAILPDMEIREIKGMYCKACSCPLSPKVRSKGATCPKGKW